MDWTIERVSQDADLGDVLAIESASFTNPWKREVYRRELENPDVSFLYVLRLNASGSAPAATVAFCSFWLILDELHINNLAVHPAYRRQGYGRELLEYVIALGARVGAVRATLEVRRSNEAALRLYEGLGFRVEATRRNYYEQPVEDALILWREGSAATADP